MRRDSNWHLVIAHPACTYLANSGAKHLYRATRKENGIDPVRWASMLAGAQFYADLMRACLERGVDRVCWENPVMHGYGRAEIDRLTGMPTDRYVIHPWQHGHGEQKATVLETYGLPRLTPSNVVEGREQKIWRMGPSPTRQRERSRTYAGIATAMAEQWG